MDSRQAVTTTDTSMSFTELEEFSTYTVTVNTTFNVFGSNMDIISDMMFTTPSAGKYLFIQYVSMFMFVFHVAPTGAPRDVVISMASRSINVTWDTIECIEGNGIITGYTVVFQEQGGANVPGNTVDRIFSATELTPFTNYIFQVAGVNDAGTGPFSVLTITTNEDGLLNNSCYDHFNVFSSHMYSSWSCVRTHCSSRSYFCSVHLECPSRT